MKKGIVLLVLLTMLLSACGSAATAAPTAAEPTVDLAATTVAQVLSATQTAMASEQQAVESAATTTSLNADFTDAAPIYMQLILGVMKLEGTDQVITADQASGILALVSSLQTDTTDQTADDDTQNAGPGRNMGVIVTQEQVDALVQQATALLNNDQITAISAMQITQESMQTIMEELGASMGAPQQEGTPMAEDGQMPPQGGPGGDGQGGGPAGGGGAPGGDGQAPAGDQMGASPDGGTPSPDMQMDGVMIQTQLLEAVITYLQGKTAS
jgi:hypothetical protein